MSSGDPFAALGLPLDPDLTDEQVHAAFQRRLRRVHPDIGGQDADATAAAEVTAAYAALRSASRRGEVLAELALDPARWEWAEQPGRARRAAAVSAARAEREFAPAGEPGRPQDGRAEPSARVTLGRRAWLRVRRGRPAWLAARTLVAAVVPLVSWRVAPGSAAVPALAVGAATWLVLTGRWDLAPRARR